MQEIWFRGRRVDDGQWVEGFYYEDILGKSVILNRPITCSYAEPFEVVPETVGRFTGLYDHTSWDMLAPSEQEHWLKQHKADEWRGKMIFEGDVLEIHQDVLDDVRTAVVCYGMYAMCMSEVESTNMGFHLDFGGEEWWLRKDIGYWLLYGGVRVFVASER